MDKQASKFNDEEAQFLLEWIRVRTLKIRKFNVNLFQDLIKEDINTCGERATFRETLKDGQVLCSKTLLIS